MARALSEIADEIKKEWRYPHFRAITYIEAMSHIKNLDDPYDIYYGYDIVHRFLATSGRWDGDKAKQIKAELRRILRVGD